MYRHLSGCLDGLSSNLNCLPDCQDSLFGYLHDSSGYLFGLPVWLTYLDSMYGCLDSLFCHSHCLSVYVDSLTVLTAWLYHYPDNHSTMWQVITLRPSPPFHWSISSLMFQIRWPNLDTSQSLQKNCGNFLIIFLVGSWTSTKSYTVLTWNTFLGNFFFSNHPQSRFFMSKNTSNKRPLTNDEENNKSV